MLGEAPEKKVLAPINGADERRRWDAVARTQRALLDGDLATVREMVAGGQEWPVDASVRRWVERLRQRCGVAAAGPTTIAVAGA
jgi:hypothetical protein